MLRALLASLLWVSLIGAPSLASAQGNPLIQRGADEYDELRYEEALQTLSAALVRSGNSEDDRATIYRLLAFTYLALGRQEEAAGAYRSLLAINPEFVPEDLSPRMRGFLEEVQTQWEAEGRPGVATAPPAPVSIAHSSPAQADPGEDVELSATLEDSSGRVNQLVLAYRQGTDNVFQRLDCEFRDGTYFATIPGDDVAPPLVEYYFEAVDTQNLPIAARGDVAAPLRIAVEGEGEGGVATKWWFWTIIGVAVVGAAVTTGILLRDDGGGGGTPQGTLIINVR
ncbi:MAG: tetratricopeptide repeat protein [Myxococcota bacterium]